MRRPLALTASLLTALAGLVLAFPALARTVIDNPITSDNFQAIVLKIANWAVAIAAPVVSVMVIWAGYLYLTGGGNPEQIKKATQALTWAVIGFIVVLAAASVSALIRSVLGAK